MRRKIVCWLCKAGIRFLDWGYAEFGTEGHEDWQWRKKTYADLRAILAKNQSA